MGAAENYPLYYSIGYRLFVERFLLFAMDVGGFSVEVPDLQKIYEPIKGKVFTARYDGRPTLSALTGNQRDVFETHAEWK